MQKNQTPTHWMDDRGFVVEAAPARHARARGRTISATRAPFAGAAAVSKRPGPEQRPAWALYLEYRTCLPPRRWRNAHFSPTRTELAMSLH